MRSLQQSPRLAWASCKYGLVCYQSLAVKMGSQKHSFNERSMFASPHETPPRARPPAAFVPAICRQRESGFSGPVISVTCPAPACWHTTKRSAGGDTRRERKCGEHDNGFSCAISTCKTGARLEKTYHHEYSNADDNAAHFLARTFLEVLGLVIGPCNNRQLE